MSSGRGRERGKERGFDDEEFLVEEDTIFVLIVLGQEVDDEFKRRACDSSCCCDEGKEEGLDAGSFLRFNGGDGLRTSCSSVISSFMDEGGDASFEFTDREDIGGDGLKEKSRGWSSWVIPAESTPESSEESDIIDRRPNDLTLLLWMSLKRWLKRIDDSGHSCSWEENKRQPVCLSHRLLMMKQDVRRRDWCVTLLLPSRDYKWWWRTQEEEACRYRADRTGLPLDSHAKPHVKEEM